jgi:hypothetical protein
MASTVDLLDQKCDVAFPFATILPINTPRVWEQLLAWRKS